MSIQYSLDNSLQNMSTLGTQTDQIFCDSTIIQGFPTQKRPPLFLGLELGLTFLLGFIGASWSPVFDNGRVVLKGYYHTLELVNHTQNVLLWHIVHPGSTSCSFSECPSRNEHKTASSDNLNGLQNVKLACENRHLVANLEYLGVPVVNLGSPMDKSLGRVDAQTGISSVEMRGDFEPTLSPVEDRSSTMDSSGDSLDSDMLSISSEDTDSIGNLDLEDPLASIIDEISHRIFVEYKVAKGFKSRPQWAYAGNYEAGDSPGSSGSSGSSGNSDNKSKSRATSQPHGSELPRSGKRGRPVEDDEDRDGGFRKPPRPTKRAAVSPNRPRTRALACPFWKLEPQAHGKCFPRRFNRISDVKSHLRRKHKQAASDYCQRCWVAFENKAHKASHLSEESGQRCKYDPAARPPGIDNAMDAALNKKSNPKYSTAEQWFVIWEIVFPDEPRPSSPYIEEGLSEDATQLIERIVNQWPSVLANDLGEAGVLAASNDLDRLKREHLIRATLVRLSDDFSAEQARIRAARAPVGHQSPGAQTSSSSARADSAIEMGSYQSDRQQSAGSSNEASRSIPEPAIPQLRIHSPARNQSGVMHNRRERLILPLDQNSFNVNFDQQQTPMPPPTTSSRAMLPDLPNTQTTDVYGVGHSFGSEFTIDDPFPPLAENPVSRGFSGTGEFDANASLESMEVLADFNWSTFES